MPSWFRLKPETSADPQQLELLRLVSLCANNPDNAELWAEFLRRFSLKIKAFIRGTVRQFLAGTHGPSDSYLLVDAAQETDLFQNTIIRLVENDCAALRRFSGTEPDFLVYLAVVARSTVRDHMRRTRAAKRVPYQKLVAAEDAESLQIRHPDASLSATRIEREILAREVADLSLRTINRQSGEDSARDRLIFQLYFAHDLSTAQIAQCKAIGLSKTGVEKALNRLKGRVRSAAIVSSAQTVKSG